MVKLLFGKVNIKPFKNLFKEKLQYVYPWTLSDLQVQKVL